MFIRNGIKSILRERGRATLFSLLIILLTLTMILSLSVLLYTNAVMASCDEAYRSIALVEYMGTEYPNEDEADIAARSAAAALSDESILSVPGVTAWTRGNTAFASTEGFERRFGTMPYRNRAVIIVSNISNPIIQWASIDKFNRPVEEDGFITYYTCILKTSLYSRNGREGVYIDLLTDKCDFVPEKGKSYVLNGAFIETASTSTQLGAYPMNGYSIFQVDSFFEADDLPYAEAIEGEDVPEVFFNAAEHYRTMNNYVHIVPCRDVNDAYAFHQGELQLVEGEMPNPEEAYSCVITNDLATQLGLKPGDTFTTDSLQGTTDDRYKLTADGKSQTFTVSGIAGESTDYGGTVWVIAEDADTPMFGYLLGTVSLRNDLSESAVEALQKIAPEQVRVTLLDQGYNAAAQPFKEVEKTAVTVLLVCSACILAVLLLFAFLYVGRQQTTVKIMVSMGTPSRKISLWFLSGALVICGASSILGAAIGTILRPTVFNMIAAAADAAKNGEGLRWYSETAIGIVKHTAFDPQVPLWPSMLAVLGIVALALLFCLRFLRMARQGGTRKKGKSKVHLPRGKSTSLGLGGLGFSLLSIRRGGLRSLAVPLVSMVLTVTVIVLGGVYQGWQNELDDAMENTRIDGMVVSLNGRHYSGLAMPINDVRTLLDMEGIENLSVSYSYRYWLPEDEPSFTSGSFGQAHRQAWIDQQPEMVTLNSLSAAKEFYYTDTASAVTWLDGWDETMLEQTNFTPLRNRVEGVAEEKLIPGVCSAAFLEEHNMTLGDTFSCLALVEYSGVIRKEIPLNLIVVGSYVQQGGRAQVYVPLSCHIQTSLLTIDDPSSVNRWDRYSFRTCRFQLSSASELDAVRQLLRDKGFSAVGHISRNRTTIVLRDAAFMTLVENMERNIAMGKFMSTVISLLIVLLGFIISWLMIFSRRREFALMRGFGAQKRKVFASFFIEQAILSLVGCLVGCILLIWLYAGGLVQALAVGAYLICYLLGASISILMIGKTDLMDLLTIRE